MHVLIIGTGLAGLGTALSLPVGTRVTIVSKSALGESNSAWAQGGIAAALATNDSAELHALDTLEAGAGLSDPAAVRYLTEHGPEAIDALQRWGVCFDGVESGHPALGREAAHSVNRIVHAGGDATGANVMAALVARVRERSALSAAGQSAAGERAADESAADQSAAGAAPQVLAPFAVLEQTAVSRLRLHEGRVIGVETVSRDGTHSMIDADAVVLATGGAGQLFAHTSNPAGATGDGIALALEVGAKVTDLEFVQFHPTTLAGADGFLISEAVRGEGAVLVDDTGHRFMPDFHPLAELAPRDVVASAISEVMQEQEGRPVLLDATALDTTSLGASRLAQRFPTIDAATRAAGYDWATQPIPVTPAAHYMMGGVVTDRCGRSSLPGLWAVGEVARTGVHGANRLASNSLLEALVFAQAAADDIASGTRPGMSIVDAVGQDAAGQDAAPSAATGRSALTRHELQQLMWQRVGLRRDSAGLALAEATLTAATMVHSAGADPVEILEDRALCTVALAVVRAATARKESIGAHRRSDDVQIRKQSA